MPETFKISREIKMKYFIGVLTIVVTGFIFSQAEARREVFFGADKGQKVESVADREKEMLTQNESILEAIGRTNALLESISQQNSKLLGEINKTIKSLEEKNEKTDKAMVIMTKKIMEETEVNKGLLARISDNTNESTATLKGAFGSGVRN